MMSISSKPNWATAWIFCAIYIHEQDSVSLSKLIASADGLNHATPTEYEISSSLAYLEQHGLVQVKEHCFQSTLCGTKVFNATSKRKGGMFTIADNAIKDFNRQLDYSKSIILTNYPFLTPQSIENAFNEYRKSIARS